jgi:hypothetical protein
VQRNSSQGGEFAESSQKKSSATAASGAGRSIVMTHQSANLRGGSPSVLTSGRVGLSNGPRPRVLRLSCTLRSTL